MVHCRFLPWVTQGKEVYYRDTMSVTECCLTVINLGYFVKFPPHFQVKWKSRDQRSRVSEPMFSLPTCSHKNMGVLSLCLLEHRGQECKYTKRTLSGQRQAWWEREGKRGRKRGEKTGEDILTGLPLCSAIYSSVFFLRKILSKRWRKCFSLFWNYGFLSSLVIWRIATEVN